MTLFNDTQPSEAIFSDCRKFRYMLRRTWNTELPAIMFIGLNPSKANEVKNDHTVSKVVGFARRWGFGTVYMLNCFSYVSTKPKDCKYDVQETTDKWLLEIGGKVQSVVFAWGNFKEPIKYGRVEWLVAHFPEAICLSKNNNGSPQHPLMAAYDVPPIKYRDPEFEEEGEDDFQSCDECDLPDACADWGCAIKQGIKQESW